ncbi:MAG: aldehyde dehydrogenase family protein, partial [Hyphomicrobium sp.]
MSSLAYFQKLAHEIAFPQNAIINGQCVKAVSGETFDNISPRDGTVLNKVAKCDKEDVDLAVRAARNAFEKGTWRNMHYRQKKQILFKFADLIEKNSEHLALMETLDVGKPIKDSLRIDVPGSIRTFRYYAEALDKIYGEVGPQTPDRISFAVHEPLGVVGAIVPWNFPLLMAAWKIAPALAMGNSIVLKPAEQSPLTALKIGELALEAGMPEGILNVVPGFGPTAGKALATHMDVDMVAFTGSGSVGKLLMQYSGQSNLKRVSLELGGKSPQIVFEDCPDLNAAAVSAAWSIFFNQGEVCTASSRLLVQETIAEKFIEKVIMVSKKIIADDPLDPMTTFGALVSNEQLKTTLSYIASAQKENCMCLLGGNQILENSGGFFVEPTIFSEVQPHHILAKEEVFGPVLAITKFKTPEEAVHIANSTIYGLAAG